MSYTIQGIDVSKWEPVIDWNKVKQAGYRFAFIKCSQDTFSDPLFSTHWTNSKGILPRGAYHLIDTVSSPASQAEKFFRSLGNNLGELPFVLDLEKWTGGTYYGSQNWYNYLERLNTLSGRHPIIIYTNYYYWLENVYRFPNVVDVNYFGQYPLWISRYKATFPLIPPPWNNWLFWQYTDEALIDGVTDQLGRLTECDVNYFNGTEEQFQSILLPNSGEPPVMSTVLYYADLKSGLQSNIRPTPSQSGTPVRTLTGPYTISLISEKTIAEGYDWYKVELPIVGWVAMTNSYTNFRPAPVTTPSTHVVEVIIDGVSVYRTELS